MSAPALLLECSVVADVGPARAWALRTDVATWRDPPATFAIDGPFVEGTRGETRFPDRDPVSWRIARVDVGRSFVIESELSGAVLACEWRFEGLSDRQTRLTQRLALTGPEAAALAPAIEAAFGPALPEGMARIAADLAAAERTRGGA